MLTETVLLLTADTSGKSRLITPPDQCLVTSSVELVGNGVLIKGGVYCLCTQSRVHFAAYDYVYDSQSVTDRQSSLYVLYSFCYAPNDLTHFSYIYIYIYTPQKTLF